MSLPEHYHPDIIYTPPDEDHDFLARELGPEDRPAYDELRIQNFQWRMVDRDLFSAGDAREYAELLDDPTRGSGGPTEMRYTGVFRRDENGQRLVAAQTWGVSSYPPHRDTDRLLETFATAGSDNRPAYSNLRVSQEAGKGYGTVARHASALVMQANGFAIVGQKVIEADWTGHVDQVKALEPALIRRGEKEVGFPVAVSDVYGMQRTEVYVGIPRLLQYLEGRRPWLAGATIIDGLGSSALNTSVR
jgi:ketosteroid isomerase-like protein